MIVPASSPTRDADSRKSKITNRKSEITNAQCYSPNVRGISGWQWALALVSGILQVLIFPSPGIYFLCWIALVPLLATIIRPPQRGVLISPSGQALVTTPAQGFWLGYVSGLIWYGGSCFWVYHVMHWYGGLSVPVAFGVLLLFCFYLSLYNGLFGLLLAAALRRGRGRHGIRNALLLAPFFWVAVELARARITGFPWDLLGTAQVNNIPLTRIATATGVYGVSFIIALVNSGIAASLFAPARQMRHLLAVALAIALMLQLGVFAHFPASPATHSALLVQQNVPLNVNWTRASLDKTVQELSQLSALPAGTQDPRLIVWPESPAPFFSNDPEFHGAISGLARDQNAYMIGTLVGALLPPPRPGAEPDLTNRAVLVNPAGMWIGYYDKIHLVPFGEYVPFQSIFRFASKLTQEVGNFVPGKTRKVFDIAGHKFATFICYEAVFPDEIRQFAANGAEVFVNVSDDGWYGRYGAPGQHLNMARMRAIENHRWLLRATNSGITASIDPLGRIATRAPSDQRITLTAPYDYVNGTTFYTRYGDWFAWACVIISILGLTLRMRVRAVKITP
jgi:apolipoprotein N-acyltransferase